MIDPTDGTTTEDEEQAESHSKNKSLLLENPTLLTVAYLVPSNGIWIVSFRFGEKGLVLRA